MQNTTRELKRYLRELKQRIVECRRERRFINNEKIREYSQEITTVEAEILAMSSGRLN